uniref:dUTP diphosphatase n=1 Tax=Sinocyclocheilus grahami TaxID=75366 RepID=A0A672KC36_SINGR
RNSVFTAASVAYDYSIGPMDKALVKTDIQIAVPHGHYGRVGERELQKPVQKLSGVVDEDYRGNLGVVRDIKCCMHCKS